MYGSEVGRKLRRLGWLIHARNVEIELGRLAEAVTKANFNPNEPRVPAGSAAGGQWTDGGGGSVSPVMTDAGPDPIIPGAQYAQTQVTIHTDALTGISSIDDTTKKLADTLAGILDGIEILPDTTPQKYGMIVQQPSRMRCASAVSRALDSMTLKQHSALSPMRPTVQEGAYVLTLCFEMQRAILLQFMMWKTGNTPLSPKRVREIREKTGARQASQFSRCTFCMESHARG